MPRFHFDTEDGEYLRDHDGLVLPDLDAAKAKALMVLSDRLRDYSEEYWKHEHLAVVVTDDDREPLFAIAVTPED